MIVKQNQPALYEAVALLFRQPPVPVRRGELRTAQTEGKDHGRLERRSLASSTALTGYLSRPGAAQVMRRTCRRLNLRSGLVETETTYGITSLPRRWRARNNWSNSGVGTGPLRTASTYVRDETLGEDRCPVHTGQAPQALAAFRNAILSLLRFHGWSSIAAATRRYADEPQRFLRLLGVPTL